jgi:hypothetical protein
MRCCPGRRAAHLGIAGRAQPAFVLRQLCRHQRRVQAALVVGPVAVAVAQDDVVVVVALWVVAPGAVDIMNELLLCCCSLLWHQLHNSSAPAQQRTAMPWARVNQGPCHKASAVMCSREMQPDVKLPAKNPPQGLRPLPLLPPTTAHTCSDAFYSMCTTACALQHVHYSMCTSACALQHVHYSMCTTAHPAHLREPCISAAAPTWHRRWPRCPARPHHRTDPQGCICGLLPRHRSVAPHG